MGREEEGWEAQRQTFCLGLSLLGAHIYYSKLADSLKDTADGM